MHELAVHASLKLGESGPILCSFVRNWPSKGESALWNILIKVVRYEVQLPNAVLHGANSVFLLPYIVSKVRGNAHIYYVGHLQAYSLCHTYNTMGPPNLLKIAFLQCHVQFTLQQVEPSRTCPPGYSRRYLSTE